MAHTLRMLLALLLLLALLSSSVSARRLQNNGNGFGNGCGNGRCVAGCSMHARPACLPAWPAKQGLQGVHDASRAAMRYP